MTGAPTTHPWDYYPGLDTTESYRAFTYFLALPPPRRYSDVALAIGTSQGAIGNWARAALWKDRALAWDKDIAETYQADTLALVSRAGSEVAAGQLELLTKAFALARQEILKYLALSQSSVAPVLKGHELRGLLTEVIKLERLIRGQATERVEGGFDLSGLTNEELATYEALTLKARKRSEES